jgi:hypothetical protein
VYAGVGSDHAMTQDLLFLPPPLGALGATSEAVLSVFGFTWSVLNIELTDCTDGLVEHRLEA